MTLRGALILCGAVAALAAETNPAAAATPVRYHAQVEARPIYRRDVLTNTVRNFWGQQYVMFSTANLQASADPLGFGGTPDTAMVVKNLVTGESLYNDSCFGVSAASCVWMPVSSTFNYFQVTVFAARKDHFGAADVLVNGNVLDAGVPFGGRLINLAVPDRQRPYVFQTVQTPNGADDTQLILFDRNWREKAHSDDDGIGLSSRIQAVKASGDRLLVGAWSASTRGYTAVVINDCVYHPDSATLDRRECNTAGLDRDRDNLSDALEAELGTNANLWDTDGDGLGDFHEVIGRRVGSSEQELAVYGADPRRRDIFLEYDQECRGSVQPRDVSAPPPVLPIKGTCIGGESLKASALDIAAMQDVYDDLPTLPPNPDGTRRIVIHADIGQSCANELSGVCRGASCATVCGDWGGFDVLALDDDAMTAMDEDLDGAIHWHSTGRFPNGYQAAMSPARRGLFHYVWLFVQASPQSGVNSKSMRLPDGANGAAAHELGHSLGLRHEGVQIGGQMNGKSAYPSTMNYIYQTELYGVVSRPRFSLGKMDRIDHTNLDESSYSPQVGAFDRAYLGDQPYYYDLHLSSVLPYAVDFNYDGRVNSPSGEPVMYDMAPPFNSTGGYGWPDLFQHRRVGTAVPTGGGAIAIVPALLTLDGKSAQVYLFAPFSHGGDGIYPSHTMIANSAQVEASSLSVAEFPAWTPGPRLAGHPNGEVAAVTFDFSFGRRILLLFPDVHGVLHYRLFDPANPYGGTEWSPVPGWVSSTRARQASVTVVKAGPGAQDDRVDVVFRDISATDNEHHTYLTSIDYDGNWAAAPALQWRSTGDRVSSYFTPGIAEAPNGYVYLATMIADVPEDHPLYRQLRFFRRPSGTTSSSWERVHGLGDTELYFVNKEGVELALRRRLNLVFLPYLERGHEPFSDGSGYLAVFYNTGKVDDSGDKESWHHNRVYTTGWISPTETVHGAPIGPRQTYSIDRPYIHHSPAVAVRWGDAVSYYTASNFSTGMEKVPMYMPFSSGTPPVAYPNAPVYMTSTNNWSEMGSNVDTDDAAIMSNKMCRVVRAGTRFCSCEPDAFDVECSNSPTVADSNRVGVK